MKDEIILRLIYSSSQDVVLGMNYLASKDMSEIVEFFDNYAEKKVRNYSYLLHPRLLIIPLRTEDTLYILNPEYDLVHCNNTLQLCRPGDLSSHYSRFIKL